MTGDQRRAKFGIYDPIGSAWVDISLPQWSHSCCDATSQAELLCIAPFYDIEPHLLKFSPMVVNMTLANNVIAGRDQRIADLAYRMWEEDGRPEGHAEAHWLRAAVLVDEAAPKKKPALKAAATKTPKKK